MKYLIVEDDFSDVALTRLKLKRIGFEVTLANPREALEENRENRPEVVQLDGLDGKCFELHKRLKQDNSDAEFLLYSSRQELYGEATKAGMKAFNKSLEGERRLCEYVGQLLKR